MATALVPGRCTLRKVLHGRERECDVYAPERVKVTPDTKHRVGLIACDGVIRRHQPRDRMVQDYGLGQVAADCGFFLVNPQALSPLWGMRQAGVRGWSTPGSLVRHNRRYDDIDFIRCVVGELTNELGIGVWYGAGFSSGAHFMHLLAARCPGMFKGVLAVGGTDLEDQPAPAPGTHLIVFHGDQDLRLPYKGSWSKGFRRRLETIYAIGWKIRGSKPWRQFIAYAQANGLDPKAVLRDTIREVISRTRITAKDLLLVEYILGGEFGEHDWYTEIVNQLFVKDFGLDQLVEI